MNRADVVIVGSGVMGAATAWWLTRLQPGLKVTLVESDTRYEKASSSLSASGPWPPRWRAGLAVSSNCSVPGRSLASGNRPAFRRQGN